MHGVTVLGYFQAHTGSVPHPGVCDMDWDSEAAELAEEEAHLEVHMP